MLDNYFPDPDRTLPCKTCMSHISGPVNSPRQLHWHTFQHHCTATLPCYLYNFLQTGAPGYRTIPEWQSIYNTCISLLVVPQSVPVKPLKHNRLGPYQLSFRWKTKGLAPFWKRHTLFQISMNYVTLIVPGLKINL